MDWLVLVLVVKCVVYKAISDDGRQRPKHVVVNCYVVHPLIANKYSCVLTVHLPFCNFAYTCFNFNIFFHNAHFSM